MKKGNGAIILSVLAILIFAVSLLAACSPMQARLATAKEYPGIAEKYPGPLVSTEWVVAKLDTIKDTTQTNIRLVDVSVSGYGNGHIPGAVHMRWPNEVFDLESDINYMILTVGQMEKVATKFGITPDTHIVLYSNIERGVRGDGYFPMLVTRVYWTLKYWNFNNVSIIDGGMKKWNAEGRPITTDVPAVTPRDYKVKYPPNVSISAKLAPHVMGAMAAGKSLNGTPTIIVDSREPAQFQGKKYYLRQSIRAGHIPGAINVPALDAVKKDGTFKSKEELKTLYKKAGVTPDKEIIIYDNAGVLSSLSWFVLSEILEHKNIRNYDASMAEYGNRLDLPLEPGTIFGIFPKGPIH